MLFGLLWLEVVGWISHISSLSGAVLGGLWHRSCSWSRHVFFYAGLLRFARSIVMHAGFDRSWQMMVMTQGLHPLMRVL